jgi:hypothetical protein
MREVQTDNGPTKDAIVDSSLSLPTLRYYTPQPAHRSITLSWTSDSVDDQMEVSQIALCQYASTLQM